MKSFSILALAATASATFNWNDATGFKNPGNTDNQCNDQQSSGFSWGDLESGSFSSYGGLSWSGFTCDEGYGKRTPGSRFAPRTQKVVSGSCGHDSSSSPSFSCSGSGSSSYGGSSSGGSSFGGSGSSGSSSSGEVSAFSVDTIDVTAEFSCSLEFQYGMEDGSICKQRSDCSSEGSTVKNTQCGGAKNVTVVYPQGQSGDKIPPESSTCGISIQTISFDCGSASSTATKATQTFTYATSKETSPSKPTVTKPAGESTTSTAEIPGSPSETGKPGITVFPSSPASTAFSYSAEIPSASAPASIETPAASVPVETPAASIPVETPAASVPVETPAASVPVETPAASVPVETPAASVPVESSTNSNSPVTQSAPASVEVPTSVVSTTYEVSSTFVTSFIGTSTIYSTSYQTITSCAPTVTDCPAKSGTAATTTVVVAVSTTICPITETQTSVFTTSHAITLTQTSGVPAAETPAGSSPSSATEVSPVGVTGSSLPVVAPSGTTVTPVSSVTSLSYPTIVPACISTWNYIVGCVDNSDTSCYCPDSTFVQNVYDCLYAYGESDEEVSEAVQYFQGLCGGYAQGNPAVATAATITAYLTSNATITFASPTTIVVTATTVVPCTDGAGSTIPSSSSTLTTAVSLTVPQVGLTTSVGLTTTQVGIIPVTSYGVSPVPSKATGAASAVPPYATGASSPNGAGSGSGTVSGSPNGTITGTTPIVTAGAAHVGAGAAGLAMAVVAAVFAL